MTKAAELAKMGEVLTNSQIGGRRNIIINGAMQVAQRGTSTTLAHDGTTDGYSPDRFRFTMGGTHEQLDGTVAQVADHPTSANGKSLKWTTGTAESSYDADEYVYIVQKIEAQNLQHLRYATSNAETVTLSFYVKSSITGTFAVGFYKPDTSTRIFNKTYTIDSANTWEKKTLTFVGDTDSGAGIVNDNGTGLYVSWHLSAGTNIKGGGSVGAWKNYSGLTDWADGQATNAIMTTASATFQITECQLEVGSQATPFEHRSFGEELALCQRYYTREGAGSGGVYKRLADGICSTTTAADYLINLSTPLRATPTLETSGNVNHYVMYSANALDVVTALALNNDSDDGTFNHSVSFYGTVGSGLVAGDSVQLITNANASYYLALDAEL